MTNFSADLVPGKIRDVDSLNYWESVKKEYAGDEEMLHRGRVGIARFGRDNARTPMQWSGEKPHAGFTTGRIEGP